MQLKELWVILYLIQLFISMNLVTAISGLCGSVIPSHLLLIQSCRFFWGTGGINKESFLNPDNTGQYQLKEPFNTQRKVEQYFAALESNAENEKIKPRLI